MNTEINAGLQRQLEHRKHMLTGVGLIILITLFCLYHYGLISWPHLILWGSGLGLLLTAILLFSDYRLFKTRVERELLELEEQYIRKLSEKERQLEATHRHLNMYSDRICTLNDLQDSISQGIHGIVYTVHSLRSCLDCKESVDPDTFYVLEHLETTALQVIYELKAMALELNPEILLEKGLGETLKLHCDLFARRHNLQIDHEISIDRHLPADIQMALYRITQEAFTNIQKHSGATQVLLSLTTKGRALRLIIQDNGRGFDPETITHGKGLENIAALAWENKGTYRLSSYPGQGTSIDVELHVSTYC